MIAEEISQDEMYKSIAKKITERLKIDEFIIYELDENGKIQAKYGQGINTADSIYYFGKYPEQGKAIEIAVTTQTPQIILNPELDPRSHINKMKLHRGNAFTVVPILEQDNRGVLVSVSNWRTSVSDDEMKTLRQIIVDIKKTPLAKDQATRPPAVIEEEYLTPFEDFYFRLVQLLSVRFFEKCNGRVYGVENIAALKEGFILASNHVSYLDWLVLFSIFKKRMNKEISFLAKEKLYKSFVWKKLIKAARCIKVTETGISVSSLRRMYKIIRCKGVIGVFPEGTRSPDSELLQARDGIAKIAALTKAPVIPVGLKGFYEAWPRHKLFPTIFNDCSINIGAPIYISDFPGEVSSKYDSAAFVKTVMNSIAGLIGKKYKYDH